MRNLLKLSTMALAGLLVSATVARADRSDNALSQINSTDRDFINKAAAGGMLEVKLGQLAVQRASDPAVRQFGQRMIDDHTKANDQLRMIATRLGIQLPTALPADEQSKLDDLTKLQGHDFDKKYMDMMIKDHDDTVSLFQKEESKGEDPELKNFSRDTLRVIKLHDTMAHRDMHRM